MTRLFFLLSLLMLLPAGAVPLRIDPPPKTVLIGFSGPLSGVSELVGKSLANAAEMALGEVNRQNPRIGGQRVFFRLVRKDDRNDVRTSVRVARQLLDAGVVAVIGTANSGTTQAVGKLFADAGVPLVSPAATSSALTSSGFSSFFRLVGHDEYAARDLAQFAVQHAQIERFAVVDNGTLFGSGVANSFAAQVQAAGALVVAREHVGFVSDLREVVRRMKQFDAQVIFFGGYNAQSVWLTQLIQQERLDITLMLASSGAASPHFIIAARSAANGTIAIEPGLPPTRIAGLRRFEQEYTERFGFNLFGLAPFAYDAAQVLVAAMRQANSVVPQQVTAALRTIQFKGLTGVIAFDGNGDPRHPVFTVYQATDQKWVALKTYEGR